MYDFVLLIRFRNCDVAIVLDSTLIPLAIMCIGLVTVLAGTNIIEIYPIELLLKQTKQCTYASLDQTLLQESSISCPCGPCNIAGLDINFFNFEPLVRRASIRWTLVARKRFLLVQCVKYQQKEKCLVFRRASLHGNMLAWQPDLVVAGKRTVLSVEPWYWRLVLCPWLCIAKAISLQGTPWAEENISDARINLTCRNNRTLSAVQHNCHNILYCRFLHLPHVCIYPL
jgi:hypothetical protein